MTLLAAALLAAASSCAAQEVVAVLSSESAPYREAFAAFQEAFGSTVPALSMGEGRVRLPPRARAVVAFGSKAALVPYPDRVALVSCLAPAALLAEQERAGPLVRVGMLPEPRAVVAGLKAVQPGLRRLAVLWTTDAASGYRERMEAAASALGVSLVAAPAESPEDLPDALRGLLGRADALWLPPDPALATPRSFATIQEFSWANKIPFYAPTRGLVQSGAAASVSASFAELGRTAAAAVKEALAGARTRGFVFPERAELSVNLSAAERAGLKIPEAALKKADKVFP